MSGSAFGRGAFGRGPYSGETPPETPLPIRAASRIRASAVVTRQPAVAAVNGAPAILAAGHALWTPDPAECGPWTPIGGGVAGLPNSAGGMFP